MRIAMVLAAALTLAAVAMVPPVMRTLPVSACIGGMAPVESLAETDLIFIGRAILVGDNINRAPTPTPTATPTPDGGTPTARPAEPSPTPPPAPEFDLTGIGVTLELSRVIMGTMPPPREFDWDARAYLERLLRDWESGNPPSAVGTCGFASFIPRYTAGGSYLFFMHEYQGQLNRWGILRIEGEDVVLDDQGLLGANYGLYMRPETYDRHFTSVTANDDRTVITADRMPLNTLLRAVAALRGDPSIAPPETGSAGLAAGR